MAEMTMSLRERTRGETKEWEKWAALAGGGTLAALGLWRRSAAGAALAGAGGFLLYRGLSSRRPLTGLVPGATARPISARVAVTVAKSPAEVYAFFRNLENLPRFMQHLESVRSTGRQSHWVARAPAGGTVEWDAEIADERENELLAWRSGEQAKVPNWGRVRFHEAPGRRGTEVYVELEYLPPAGEVGRLFAKLMGEEPEMQIYGDMHRFKQILETGEIATTEGQPSGRRSSMVRAASRLYGEAARDREMQRAG